MNHFPRVSPNSEIPVGNVPVNMGGWGVASDPIVLPQRYYLAHFTEMLAFVSEKYAHALDEVHVRFLETFPTLGEEARCLYVRLANRRGCVFRRDHLRYPEIGDIDGALAELHRHGFLRHPEPSDFGGILALMDRPALTQRLRESGRTGFSSVKKGELVRLAAEVLSFDDLVARQQGALYLIQTREEEVSYFLFLYFGGLDRDLKTFAMRDLGRARTAPFLADFQPRFASGEAARACYHYARILRQLEEAGPEEVLRLHASVGEWPGGREPSVETLHHRALHRLGRLLERDGCPEQALEVYGRSDQYPATERTVRLLHAAGRHDEAEGLLLRFIDDPSCDGELFFAEDFLERKFRRKKTGRLTELLRSSPTLELDETGRDRPEAAAVVRFRRDGVEAAHVENRIWQQLFGLLFWDLLFGPEHASLHDPFDFTPQDLSTGVFFERHGPTIAARLGGLDEPAEALVFLEAVWLANGGLPNSLVPWDETLFAHAKRLVAGAPAGALAPVLEAMARDFRQERSGFPDLILFDEAGPRFVEVKTEGDQIRRQQLVQMERLRRAGFSVGVAKVRWIVDPEQDYVVVDLETTGGDPSRHRITEIGAVRVRGGRVVEEWSSLVNPGRRIPSFISKLTGITDEMVASAPPFEELASDFAGFLGDAVFVAHRAKFDQGFLKAEFARLGKTLSGPALCTVVESRRHFPGLPGYGLAALCHHFGIPLESHHRALCDARATASLWLKINEKRLAP